jgi:hypothetical protein
VARLRCSSTRQEIDLSGDAFADPAAEMLVFFQQAQSGILHQMLGIDTRMRSDLRSRSSLWRKMHFQDVFSAGETQKLRFRMIMRKLVEDVEE